jgi:2-C-methyl-D-erythritol 4-phosphate cytidylyltransferase
VTPPADLDPAGGRVGAVLVAAGRGERLGDRRPKALVEVAGRSLVAWAVVGLREAGIEQVVVVHTPGEHQAFAGALRAGGSDDGPPGADDHGRGEVLLVPGGADRSASVRAGVAALPDAVRLVAVHDAARAFTPSAVIRAAVAAVSGDVVAAAPALPVADTLKRVRGAQIVATVDRDDLVAVQTPQVFPRAVLAAVAAEGEAATDDLALVERRVASGDLTGQVVWVPGSPRGLKVTFPEDLVLAEAFAADRT